MGFRYQAIDAAGQTVVDTVDAASPKEAAEILHERGLFVTRLDGAESQVHEKSASTSESFSSRSSCSSAEMKFSADGVVMAWLLFVSFIMIP